MQSFEAGAKAEAQGEVTLEEIDVPHWDDDYPFWQSTTVEFGDQGVDFRRIVMPMHEDDERMSEWLAALNLDAVVCSGSRRNVSIWEDWMGPAGSLLRASALSGRPTLGLSLIHI